MFEDALVCLSHVASQLVYRWFPEPHVSPVDEVDLKAAFGALSDYQSFKASEWYELLRWIVDHRRDILPWIDAYLAQGAFEALDAKLMRLACAAHTHLAKIRRHGGGYIPITSPAYPTLLRSIADPPLAFSFVGDARLFETAAISVVGSRRASALALQQSFVLGRHLADAGFAVVSGGAYGCDIAVHQGVLASRCCSAPAIVVFAGGLEELYPKGNAHVFRELAANQAVFISERLWEAPCRPLDFTARNRIIAGLSETTVVMQAAVKSGAMITARLALDQGRDVAVLVHPDGDVRASGGASLLADGARGFRSADECLGQIGIPNSSFPYGLAKDGQECPAPDIA